MDTDQQIKIELPDKPSELIRVALADLEQVEKDPRYRVSMSTWHNAPNPDVVALNPNHGLQCRVCLAGAALACHGYPIGQTLNGFDDILDGGKVRAKIMALDLFRNGHVTDGLMSMGIDAHMDTRLPYYYAVTDYHLDRDKFKTTMIELANLLEKYDY